MERMCLIFMYTWLCKGLPFIGSKPNNIPCLHVQMPYHSVAMCASGRTEFESRIPLKILFACYTVKTSTTLKPDQSHFLCALLVVFFCCCFNWGKTEFRTQSIWSDFFCSFIWWKILQLLLNRIDCNFIYKAKPLLYFRSRNVNREIGALTHQHESLTKKKYNVENIDQINSNQRQQQATIVRKICQQTTIRKYMDFEEKWWCGKVRHAFERMIIFRR